MISREYDALSTEVFESIHHSRDSKIPIEEMIDDALHFNKLVIVCEVCAAHNATHVINYWVVQLVVFGSDVETRSSNKLAQLKLRQVLATVKVLLEAVKCVRHVATERRECVVRWFDELEVLWNVGCFEVL